MTDTLATRSELAPGTPVLGRCVVERFVRRGPLASVYTARTRTGTDAFMLRVVHADLVTWSDRAQSVFTREIERVKGLKHPCIPKIVAYDCSPAGPMLLTAHTGAPSLRELIVRNQRPTPAGVGKIVHAVSAALSAMHHHSTPFVHRAVAPENVMVGDRGIWIEEAGLVHAVVTAEMVQDRPSYFSFPGYQSPEEFRRSGDARADAFGLALVAFEALTGRSAFENLGPAALSTLIQDGQFPRATEFCPELPSTIDAVFERAWTLSEHDGYVEPTSFAADFAHVIESLGIHSNRILVPSGLVPSSMPPPMPAGMPDLEDPSTPAIPVAAAPVGVIPSGPLERSARPTLRMGSSAVAASPIQVPTAPTVPRIMPTDEPTPIVMNPLIPDAAYPPSSPHRQRPDSEFPSPPMRREARAPSPSGEHPAARPLDPEPTFPPRKEVDVHIDPLISLPSLDGPPSSPGFELGDVESPSRRGRDEQSAPEIDPSLLESIVPDPPAPLPPPVPQTPPPPPVVRSAPPPLPRSDHPEPVRSQPAPLPSPISHPPAAEPLPPPMWRPDAATILAASRVLSFSTVVAAVVATIGLVQASRSLDALSASIDSVPLSASAPSQPPAVVVLPSPSPMQHPDVVVPAPSVTTDAAAVATIDAAQPPSPQVVPQVVAPSEPSSVIPPPPPSPPAPPSPDQLPSEAARRAVMVRLRPLVSDCVEGLDPERFPVRVRYAGSSGAVLSVRLRGIYAEAPIGPCIEEAVRSVRLPSFPAPEWETLYTFMVPPPR